MKSIGNFGRSSSDASNVAVPKKKLQRKAIQTSEKEKQQNPERTSLMTPTKKDLTQETKERGNIILTSTTTPSITITSPENGTTVNSSDFTAYWDASYDSLDHYEIKLNASSGGTTVDWTTTTQTSYSFSGIAEHNEQYHLWVKIVNGSGAEDLDTSHFWVDYEPPNMKMTSINREYQNYFPDCSQTLNLSSGDFDLYYDESDSNELAKWPYQVKYIKADGNIYYNGKWYNATQDPLSFDWSDGHYDLYLRAQDITGKKNKTSVNLTIDSHTPHLKFLPSNNTYFTSNSDTVEWKATDDDPDNNGYDDETNGTGIKVFRYKLDGGSWHNITPTDIQDNEWNNTVKGDFPLSGVSDGQHNLTVRAWDWAGWNNTTCLLFTLDTTPPSLTVTETDNANRSTDDFNITWDASDNVNFDTSSYNLDGTGWTNTTNDYHYFTKLEPGDHTLELKAYDEAGNTNTATYNFTVDLTKPDLWFIEEEDGKIYNATTFEINWNGSDNCTGIQTFSYHLENGSWANTSTANHTFNLADEGNYTIKLRAYDWAGNYPQISVWVWADLEHPSLVITSNQDQENLTSTSVNITWNGSDSIELANYSYLLDDGSWTNQTKEYHAFSDLSQGNHTFKLKAIDAAGKENSTSIWFILDVTAPEISVNSLKDGEIFAKNYSFVDGFEDGNLDEYYGAGLENFETTTAWSFNGSFSLKGLTAVGGDYDTLRTDSFSITNGHTYRLAVRGGAGWGDGGATEVVGVFFDRGGKGISSSWFYTVGINSKNEFFIGVVSPTDYENGLKYNKTTPISFTPQKTYTYRFNWWGNNTLTAFWNDTTKLTLNIGSTDTKIGFLGTGNITGTKIDSLVEYPHISYSYTSSDSGGSALKMTRARINGSIVDEEAADTLRFSTFQLEETKYRLRITAYDYAENMEEVYYAYYFDISSPTGHFINPQPDENISVAAPNITWTRSDNIELTSEVSYRVDGGSWTNTTNNWFKATKLKEGGHTTSLKIYDQAGWTTIKTIGFTIDTVQPNGSFYTRNETYFATDGPTIEWWGSDNGSGVWKYGWTLDGESQNNKTGANKTLNSLEEGEHNLTVKIYDWAENALERSVTFYIDTISPSISVTETDNANISKRTYNISWDSSEEKYFANISYRLDQGVWHNTSLQYHYFSSLSTGEHLLEVMIYDKANNTDKDAYHFTVDVTSPDLWFIEEEDGKIYNATTFEINWNGSDNSSGVRKFGYKLEGASWQNKSEANKTFTVSEEGNWTISVEVYDWSGRTTTRSVWVWVDTEKPFVEITSDQAGKNLSKADLSFAWSASDENGIATYYYKKDSSSWTQTTQTSVSVSYSTNGEHSFYVKAEDAPSKMNQTSIFFIVDTETPTSSFINEWNGKIYNSTSFELNWNASDSVTGIKNHSYRRDGGSWANTSTANHTFSGLPEGNHTFTIKVYDWSGNIKEKSVWVWVDTEKPFVEITSDQAGNNISSTQVNITWNGSDTNELMNFSYKLGHNDWTNTSQSYHLFSSLSEGTHTIFTRSIDITGKTNTTSVNFTIDTLKPNFSYITPNETYFNTNDITIKWNATDNGTGVRVYQYRVDGGNWQNQSSANLSLQDLQEGTHNITVWVYDWTGNIKDPTCTFTVDTTNPTLTINTPEKDTDPYWSNGSVDFTYDTNDENFNHTRLYINGSWNETYQHSGTTQISVDIEEGVYEVYFLSKDLAGNGNESRHITLIVDSTPPSIEETFPRYTKTQATTVEWNYTDNFKLNLTQIKLDDNSWTTVTAQGNHTYDLTEGDHTISFKTTDMVGHETIVTGTITVDLTTPDITITEPGYDEFLNSSEVTMEWNASDSHIGHYEVRIDEGDWISIGTRTSKTFTGLSEGDHTLSVKAVDKAGNTKKDSTPITVDTETPSIDIKKPSRPVTLQNFNLSWTASDSVDLKKFEIYINGTLNTSYLNTSITRHEFEDFPLGFWRITTKVYDHVNHFTNDSINVEVRHMAISISNLPEHYYTSNRTITVNWTKDGRGLDRVEVFFENEKVTTLSSTNSSYTLELAPNIDDGTYSFSLVLYDRYGNAVEDACIITLDRENPEIMLLHPSNKTIVSGRLVIEWNGTDINTTDILVNASLFAQVNGSKSSHTISLPEGNHTLRLRARDKAGNTASSSRYLVFSDLTAPKLTIQKPENNTRIKAGNSIKVVWNVEDNYGVQNTSLFIDGEHSGTWSSSTSCTIKLGSGDYKITILTVDKAGNEQRKTLQVTVFRPRKSSVLNIPIELIVTILFTVGGITLIAKSVKELKEA